MKIQYCSDLHLEFPENHAFLKKYPLKPVGDILVIAGDFYLLSYHTASISDFISYASDNFQAVYWLPGNHEFYHSDIASRSFSFQEKIRSNFFLINNKIITYENANLVFSTLWSHIPLANQWDIQQSISDFHVIKHHGKKFTPAHFNAHHQDSLSFIKKNVTNIQEGKKIVITHHVPTLYNYPEIYKSSKLNPAFAVELYDFIESSDIDYWIFGHHHSNVHDFSIGNTKLCTNQLGYVHHNENTGFRRDAYIDIY